MTASDNSTFKLYAPTDAFQNVPAFTKDLCVNLLRRDKVAEMDLLGERLSGLKYLSLMHGDIENLGFLRSFQSLQRFFCLEPHLKTLDGLGACAQLKDLHLGATFSTRPNLRPVASLSFLERLHLEGPNPRKGVEEMGPIQSVTDLRLYAPKWPLDLLPSVFPRTVELWISQGAYDSLDFIAGLGHLSSLVVAYPRKLVAFETIGEHAELRSVQLSHAISGLESCSQLGMSNSITKLKIASCNNLKDVKPLALWPKLQEVWLEACPKVPAAQIAMLQQAGKKVHARRIGA